VILVPSLKYPPDPPSVGNPETIGIRTAAYFLIVTISLAMMTLSIKGWKYWRKSWGNWNAALLAFCLYVVSVSIFARFLPVIDEVPAEFPASLLWNFRIASWEIQAVMWSGLGLLFGWLTERAEDGSRRYSR
jgi:predicted cobalt transporter CbtA